jgi:beta-glucanase (GH16 family)
MIWSVVRGGDKARWLLLLFCAFPVVASGGTHDGDTNAHSKWTLVWSDEFNGPNGSMPDPNKWTIINDGSGFGNNELEYYTSRSENVHQAHGNLVIIARKEHFAGPDGVSREYTSARLQTAGHFDQQYGRFEARIKIPNGQGIWPAFWMLGKDIATNPWPQCGEIDVMENVGYEPGKVHGTLHGPLYSGENPLTGAYKLPDGKRFADDFHVYAVEWDSEQIRFYVDDHLYETQTLDSIPGNKRWVFDHPFFVILDLAVGGNWPRNPDNTTPFPSTMLVDYVRVFKESSASTENKKP